MSPITETRRDYLPSFPDVLTSEQAAEALNLAPYTVRQKCRTGELRAFKAGVTWCLPKWWLNEYIEGKLSVQNAMNAIAR